MRYQLEEDQDKTSPVQRIKERASDRTVFFRSAKEILDEMKRKSKFGVGGIPEEDVKRGIGGCCKLYIGS